MFIIVVTFLNIMDLIIIRTRLNSIRLSGFIFQFRYGHLFKSLIPVAVFLQLGSFFLFSTNEKLLPLIMVHMKAFS